MTFFQIDSKNALYFAYQEPKTDKPTFVFVNPLTGSTDTWVGPITENICAQGFGYLTFDFRGQGESSFDSQIELSTNLLVSDLIRMIQHVKPKKIILVGLSIGGLYSALALESGLHVDAIVLVNTLRKNSIRLQWINETMVNVASYGGTALLMDFNLPLIAGPEFLKRMKQNALKPERFKPMDKTSGIYKLMEGSLSANWDFDWANLNVPALVMTGHLDKVFRIPEDIDQITSIIPKVERLEFPNFGHLIPNEAPEFFSTKICDFAKRILR